MIGKALHILLACLVALPLGQGGLCCCLFQAPAAREAAHAAAPTCCKGKDAPAAPASERDSAGESCSCPTLDTFLRESPAPGAVSLSFASVTLAPAPHFADLSRRALETSRLSRVVERPPKVPLHRILCIALC